MSRLGEKDIKWANWRMVEWSQFISQNRIWLTIKIWYPKYHKVGVHGNDINKLQILQAEGDYNIHIIDTLENRVDIQFRSNEPNVIVLT